MIFDSQGNLYASFFYGGAIYKYAPGGTTPTQILLGTLVEPLSMAFDSSGDLYVSNFGSNTVSKFFLNTPLATSVTIRSSLPSQPMSIGGTNDSAVAGINLTSAELATIVTAPTGTITFGDTAQAGNITFSTASPVNTAGASLVALESASGPGAIILDDGAGSGSALSGNGGSVSLTAGTGGIQALSAPNNVAEIANAATLILTSGGGLGTSQPLELAATMNLTTDTTATNGSQFLNALGNIASANLNAGTASITLAGPSTFQLVGATFSASSLIDNASLPQGVTIKTGQTLQGVGSAGPVLVQSGGSLGSTTTVSRLAVSALTMQPGSSFAVVLNDSNSYSQLTVLAGGTAALNGAALLLGGAGALGNGQAFTIVNNLGLQPIVGSFNGLSDGAVIANVLGSGVNAVIGYNGGNRNNVLMTVGSPVPSFTTLSSSANTATYGQKITFTASVSASGAAPTGAVEFFDDTTGVDLGAGVLTNSGSTTSTWSRATASTQLHVTGANADTIRAVYTPTSNTLGSSATLAGGETVTPQLLTIYATTNAKTYDYTTSAAAVPTVSGLQGTDTVSGLAEVYADRHAGTAKSLSVSAYTVNDGNGGNNYTVATIVSPGLIVPAPLTLTAQTNTKTFEGTTTAAAIPIVGNLLGADSVTALAESYGNANAGAAKVLSVSAYTILDGNGGHDYTVTTITNTTGLINRAALTIKATSNTKTYDASATAAAIPTAAGLWGSDTLTAAEVYADKNATTSKTLSVSAYTVNDGNGGNNYAVTLVADATGVINQAALTITAVANSKNFDNTTTATAVPTVSGLQGGDTVTGLAEMYSNIGPGSSIPLSVSAYTINDGNGGNNYAVTVAGNNNGFIATGVLTVTTVSTSQNSVVYGTPVTFTITVTAATGSTIPTGSVELFDNGNHDFGAATFVSSSGVTATFSLTSLPRTFLVTSAPVHTITAVYTASDLNTFGNSSATLAGGETIMPKALTVSARANTRTYDGTTSAALTPIVTGLVLGDGVAGLAEAYSSRNAGSAKTLSVSAYTIIDGNGGKNYLITTISATTGIINQASLTITARSNTKVYDATTSATAVPTVSGLIGTDTVSGLVEVYNSQNAAQNKTLSVSAYTINDANNGANYNVTKVADTTGLITQVAVNVSGISAIDKVYDGTTAATLNVVGAVITGLLPGDSVTVTSATGVFASKNVGNGIAISVTGITLGGLQGLNYAASLNQAALTAKITPKALTLTNIIANKTYDNTTKVTINTFQVHFLPLVSGDNVTLVTTGGVGAFPSKDVGTYSVTMSGLTLGGAQAANYTLTQPVTFTAGIGPQTIFVNGVTANTKVYDTTTAATFNVSNATLGGTIFAGDNISLVANGVTGAFGAKNAGTNVLATVTGFTLTGAQANDYTVRPSSAVGNITPAVLSITATGVNRVYNQNTTATVVLADNRFSGDKFAASYASAAFANNRVGSNIAVNVSGITISGTDAGNYTFNTTAQTTANITPLAIGVTGITANNKIYDGTTQATVNTSNAAPVGVINGDIVTLQTSGATATFAGPNVGNNLVVTVLGLTTDGPQGSDYTVIAPTVTANISPMPATVSDGGTGLLTVTVAIGQNIAVTSNGASYTFTSNQPFVSQSAVDPANQSAAFTGFGTTTLTLTGAGLAQYVTGISIVDAAANSTVTFNDSGPNAYANNFNVGMTNPYAGLLSFNGNSSFGAYNLSASTTANVIFNSGASLSSTSGNLTIGANLQPLSVNGSYTGVKINNARITSLTGLVTVQARGTSEGVRIENGGLISGGTNTVIVNGTGDGGLGVFGVLVVGHNSAISSSGGNIHVNGRGGVSLYSGGSILGSGSSNVSVVGQAPVGTGIGVFLTGNAGDTSAIRSAGGDIVVTGIGGPAAFFLSLNNGANTGVAMGDYSQIVAGGGGNISIEGTGGAADSNNNGVAISTVGTVVASNGGDVHIVGHGGGNAVSSGDIGVNLGGLVTAGGHGNVYVEGTAGNGSGNTEWGVNIGGCSVEILSLNFQLLIA